MSHGELRELRLRDFRCFRGRHTAPLAPLTLLVGENSTGKTSFLAAVQAVWDAAHGSRSPNFRKDPFDLGSFPDIVHSRSGHAIAPSSFAIGFAEQFLEDHLFGFEVTFESRNAAPEPVTIEWREGATSVSCRRAEGEDTRYVFESPNGSWHYHASAEDQIFEDPPWFSGFFSRMFHAVGHGNPTGIVGDLVPSPETGGRSPSKEDLGKLTFLLARFLRLGSGEAPFASAPIHARPRRTYDPVKVDVDPWGADVPSRLASLEFRDKTAWTALKEKLDAFGRESGLFDDFSVKQLTKFEGGPFQLQVRKYGNSGRKGPKRNLVDVGFGVSQVLPVLAALFRAKGPPMFLLQQPELHLHPSAQAALGSLFCRTVEAEQQLIVETHSEYIIDRIRMDIRDREAALNSDDVSVLFFERADLDVRIHPLRFDDQGNVVGGPDGYGQFFMDEARRSVGL